MGMLYFVLLHQGQVHPSCSPLVPGPLDGHGGSRGGFPAGTLGLALTPGLRGTEMRVKP